MIQRYITQAPKPRHTVFTLRSKNTMFVGFKPEAKRKGAQPSIYS